MAQRVFVGMSGGVDSSLAAAMLVEQGYDVTGVYMKNWTLDLPGAPCPWADDLADAKRVAVQLGIPFKVYDFQAEYKQLVVDEMVAAYRAGLSPNPDIMCNQEVKFRLFLVAAQAGGAELIATGHYARTSDGRLQMAADVHKDQTYFLYRVTSQALARTLFPLGGLRKTEVRAMAAARGLVTAAKRDSQGICFVGSVGIKEFLAQYVTAEPGNLVDSASGQVVGRHDGAIYYTLGQRHGLGVGGGLPYYVCGKDMAKNEVYLSRDLNDPAFWRSELPLSSLHWITTPPADGQSLQARLRHGGVLLAATLEGNILHLAQPERAIAPGQSAVLYAGDTCLGGGVIV